MGAGVSGPNGQNRIILEMLRKGPITPMDALSYARCMRLASRIDDLKKMGYLITTEMVNNGDARYARYHLAGEPNGT